MVDSVGREILVERQVAFNSEGWPAHGTDVPVKSGDRVCPPPLSCPPSSIPSEKVLHATGPATL